MKQSAQNTSAFTLIEILIAISIIAILIIIPFFAFSRVLADSRDNDRKDKANNIQAALEQYRSDNGMYPDSLSDLVDEGYLAAIPLDPFDGRSVPGTNGALTYDFEDNYSRSPDGQSYDLIVPLENGDSGGGSGSITGGSIVGAATGSGTGAVTGTGISLNGTVSNGNLSGTVSGTVSGAGGSATLNDATATGTVSGIQNGAVIGTNCSVEGTITGGTFNGQFTSCDIEGAQSGYIVYNPEGPKPGGPLPSDGVIASTTPRPQNTLLPTAFYSPTPTIGPPGSIMRVWYPVVPGNAGDIAGDNRGNIWLTNTYGYSRLTLPNENWVHYTTPYVSSRDDDLILGPDGNMWYISRVEDKLVRINTQNYTVTAFDMPLLESSSASIVAGSDGNIWVMGRDVWPNPIIYKYSTAGVQLASYGLGVNSGYRDLTADPNGDLYFTGYQNSNPKGVYRLTTNGVASLVALTYGDIREIHFGAGHIWAANYTTDSGTDRYVRVTTAGARTSFPTDSATDTTRKFESVAGPDGNMWFAVDGGVSRITSQGDISFYSTTSQGILSTRALGVGYGDIWALGFWDEVIRIEAGP